MSCESMVCRRCGRMWSDYCNQVNKVPKGRTRRLHHVAAAAAAAVKIAQRPAILLVFLISLETYRSGPVLQIIENYWDYQGKCLVESPHIIIGRSYCRGSGITYGKLLPVGIVWSEIPGPWHHTTNYIDMSATWYCSHCYERNMILLTLLRV